MDQQANRNQFQLSPEQIQDLLTRMSSDEQKELSEVVKKCTTEVSQKTKRIVKVITTRGIPMTALVLGSLYFARKNLPPKYHFGPKGWPFYAIMGIGTMTVTNFLSMQTCQERIRPKIEELFHKYNSKTNVHNSYAQMRDQNRRTIGEYAPPASSSSDAKPISDDFSRQYAPLSSYPKQVVPCISVCCRKENDFALMSGTPAGSAAYPRADVSGKYDYQENKTQYGDSGFS